MSSLPHASAGKTSPLFGANTTQPLRTVLNIQTSTHTSLLELRKHADWICVLVNLGGLLFALAQGWTLGVMGEALTWGLPIFLSALAVTRAGAGNTWTMHLNGWLLVAMAALHVHLGRGMAEYHFSFFMLLPVLLMYRDPRPLITTGVMIALHHVLFDMLQRAGFECYVFRGPFSGMPAVALHGFYVLVFVSVLCVMAHILRQHALVAEETANLLGNLDRQTGVNFKMRAEPGPTGQVSRFGKVFNEYADNMSFIVSAFRMLRTDITELTEIAHELGKDNNFQLTQSAKASNNLRDFLHRLGNQTKHAQHSADQSRKMTEDCFDLINELNQSSDVLIKMSKQVFEAHQQVVQSLQTPHGDSDAMRTRLQTLAGSLDHLGERTQVFLSKMESVKGGLSAIENQAVTLDRNMHQAIEDSHSNQRRGWEVLGAMESMQGRTERAFTALNDTVETILRAGDVVREMETRLSRFDV